MFVLQIEIERRNLHRVSVAEIDWKFSILIQDSAFFTWAFSSHLMRLDLEANECTWKIANFIDEVAEWFKLSCQPANQSYGFYVRFELQRQRYRFLKKKKFRCTNWKWGNINRVTIVLKFFTGRAAVLRLLLPSFPAAVRRLLSSFFHSLAAVSRLLSSFRLPPSFAAVRCLLSSLFHSLAAVSINRRMNKCDLKSRSNDNFSCDFHVHASDCRRRRYKKFNTNMQIHF